VANLSRNSKTAAHAQSILLEAEVYLTLQHVADLLLRPLEETLKGAELSHTQYNVLRILRGAHRDAEQRGERVPESGGLPCGEIAARMITRDPDITRLLDRLEARGLVVRSRRKKDRRVVQARITSAGVQLLKELDKPMDAMHRKQFAHVAAAHLKQLLEHLKEIRSAVEQIKACASDEEESS
jgi:MarR family transcriptional regulator, organic hydroperoxide resistance regulator